MKNISIEKKIRQFILESFLFSDDQDALPNDGSLLEMGLIDSTGILELITFLEDEFKITVADEEMLPENLDSVSRMLDFLNRKQVIA